MDEEFKDLEDDMNEFSRIEDRPNILSLMRNIIENDQRKSESVEIFDDSNHNIFPTFWGKEGQIATCRTCGKTGETITKRKCGLGNSCCSCCFIILCMCCFIPCVCFAVHDTQHYCMYCKAVVGIKTFI